MCDLSLLIYNGGWVIVVHGWAGASASPAAPMRSGGGIPSLMLAHKWENQVQHRCHQRTLHTCVQDPTGWWMSEKLDGVRCYWDGNGGMFSRNANRFHAPAFFLDGLPKSPLDGELFFGRGQFDRTMAVVRRMDGLAPPLQPSFSVSGHTQHTQHTHTHTHTHTPDSHVEFAAATPGSRFATASSTLPRAPVRSRSAWSSSRACWALARPLTLRRTHTSSESGRECTCLQHSW